MIIFSIPAIADDVSLVGNWQFNEGVGTNILDSSGNANTGTLYGNSVVNPGFETLNSQWGSGSENLLFDNTHSKTGTYSGNIHKLSAGELVQFSSNNANNNAGTTLPSSSVQYRYGGCLYIEGGASADIFFFSWNSAGGNRYDGTYDAISTAVQNQWVCINGTTTKVVPADNLFAIRVDNNGGGTVWFDDIWVNAVEQRTNGKYGNALQFDGVNDYVRRSSGNGLPLGSSPRTFMAWIKPASYPDSTYNGIVAYGKSACNNGSMLSIKNNGQLSMAFWCNDAYQTTGPAVELNSWNHVAFTYDGGTKVKFYMNGKFVQESTLTAGILPRTEDGPLRIGCTDDPGRCFNGSIDEVRIYNRALYDFEIADIYNPSLYDHSGYITEAWYYAGYDLPLPANGSWINATSAQKNSTLYIDSNRWETKLTTGHDQSDYQMYRFYIAQPSSEIMNITSTWIGYGENKTGYNTSLYIWNNSNNSWDQLDTKFLITDGTLNGSITTNLTEYVDINGYVYITAAAKHNDYPPVLNSKSVSGGYIYASASDPDGDIVEYNYRSTAASSGWTTATSWNGGSPGSCGETYYYYVQVRANGVTLNEVYVGYIYAGDCPSSCPLSYVWNGTGFEYSTDIAGASLGARTSVISYPRYYDMPGLKANNGSYNLLVREVLPEADYFDMAKLVVADVPDGYNIYTNWLGMKSFGVGWHDDKINNIRYTYPTTPQLLTTNKSTQRTPIHAANSTGVDVTDQLQSIDNNPLRETAYGMEEYILDFGEINHPEYAKLIISAWVNYIPGRDVKLPIILSVINETGQWEQAAELGSFTGDLETRLYNISNLWITEDHRLKLRPSYSKTMILVIDKVMMDDSTPVDVESTIVNISNANLYYRGNDKIIHSTFDNRIHGFNVVEPVATSNYFYGNFTKYGDVTPLLTQIDDKYAIMRYADELSLSFDEVAEVNNKHRQYFLYAFDWYVTMTAIDTNRTFIRDTVDLLPFINMSIFPYNTSVENYPYDTEHKQYINDWNTRICEDRVNGTCYNSTTGEQIINAKSANVPENPLQRSLNTNYVDLRLTFKPGFNVSGYVTDISSGLAISGALLQTNYGINTSTNESGYYHFTLINSTYTINASKFGYDANAKTTTVNGGDLTNVNISLLYKLRTLSGYITYKSSDLPLSGVLVQTNTGLNTTTNASGFYNFTVFEGTYTINASKIGYDANATTVTVGGDLTNINISLVYHPYNLSGYIIDRYSGLPLGGVTVKTNAFLNMTTGADGFYNFTLIDGEHSVMAILQNYSINSTTVTINGANIINANISLIHAHPQGRDSWNYAGNIIPMPYTKSWIPATIAQKSTISYYDSNRWETKLTNGHDQFDYQMYRFYIAKPSNEITNLTSTWIGYGENQNSYDTYLYIWNHRNVFWEQIDRKHLSMDGTLNGSITTNLTDYVDINGYLYLAAAAKHNNYAPSAPTGLSASPGYADVTISWSSVTDPDNDTVQYYAQIEGVANSGWINGTSWSFSGLSESTGYSFGIKARDTFANLENSISTGSFWTGTSKTSCPFVYIWNGTGYEYITDLQGAPIGAPYINPAGRDHAYYDLDFNKGLRLQPQNGKYVIKIRESIMEADFFDYAKLVAADVPEGYEVLTDWHGSGYGPGWHIDNSTGKKYNYSNLPSLFSIKDPRTASSVIDKNDMSVTDRFSDSDEYPAPETRSDFNYYTIDFGNIDHPEYAKLILYGWVDYHLRTVSPAQGLGVQQQVMRLEVVNRTGEWQPVAELGIFMGDLKPAIYNISNIWITNDHRIRIHSAYTRTSTNIIDKIELDDSPPVDIEVTVLNLTSAKLYHVGRDELTYANLTNKNHAANIVLPDLLMGYFYGNFTKYGDVTPLLDKIENKYVIMRHGDELDLVFPEFAGKPNKNRRFFLDAFVWYSMRKTATGEDIFLRDVVSPLPFYGMTKYPYNTSFENYPYDDENNQYLSEWNTRVCNDRVNGTCYNSTTGEQIITRLENFSEKTLPHSLNTNYVELKVNNQLIGNSIFNLRSATTLSSSYITWNNDIFSDNRVYYGLNETDVNDLMNGSWSEWNNNSMDPAIRLTGLLANTTYYYRPLTWYLGTVNDSVKAGVISTVRPGVWITPTEYMVSPAGWIGSPANFRTINISAAPLDSNGRYIHDLSLEAVVYNNSGVEINRTNLIGNGPYYANVLLNDSFSDERGYVTITNYSMAGEFSVLKWSCVNCHADGERYPSNFNSAAVHLRHTDTQTSGDCDSCHYMGHASSNYNMDGCYNECHKSGLTCNECHNDKQNSADVLNTSVLSEKYGKDVHLNKKSCVDCHGGLTSVNPSPSCTTCHPLTGSNLTSVPGSIENNSHSNKKTVACGLCHNSPHDIKSLTIDAAQCKICHTGITHNNGAQCTVCHGSDPHRVTVTGGTCIACHSSPTGDNIYAAIDTASFGKHRNINTTEGNDNLTDSDCEGCHYNISNMMNRTLNVDTRICTDCHIAGNFSSPIINNHKPPKIPISAGGKISTTAYCTICHNNSINKYIYSINASVSHYGTNTSLIKTVNKTQKPRYGFMSSGDAQQYNKDCNNCHNPSNSSYGNATLITTGHIGRATCNECHLNGSASDMHNGSLGMPVTFNCLSCHTTYASKYGAADITGTSMAGYTNCNGGSCHGNDISNSLDTRARHNVDRTYAGTQGSTDTVYLNNQVSLTVTKGAIVNVTSRVNDSRLFGGASRIGGAEYYIDVDPGQGKGIPMDALDGNYNALFDAWEPVKATIDTNSLSDGTHRIYVRGMDIGKQWSIPKSGTLVVESFGYLNGTVTNATSPIAEAIVSTIGANTTTDANGNYSLKLYEGTYTVNASKLPEYYGNSSSGRGVTPNNTTIFNIVLSEKPTGTISGSVKNG